MITRRFAILLAVVFLGILQPLRATHSTAITSVSINGIVVPPALWPNIVLDVQSVLSVSFMHEDDQKSNASFRYQIDLDNGQQHLIQTQNEGNRTFSNLPEGKYGLMVRAQSLTSDWSASPALLQFSVDAAKASAFRTELAQITNPSFFSSINWSIVSIILLVLCIALAVVTVIVLRRKPATNYAIPEPAPAAAAVAAVATQIREQKAQDGKLVKSLQDEILQLRKENETLQRKTTELAKRTSELADQNKDLESQVERVSKVKRELEDLQRQKDDVFAIIIHDIKNPASLIKNLVDLLRGYDLNSTETQEVMQDIVETTTKIVSLSQELSRVMAMDQADIHLEKQEADPAIIIESVCRRNSPAAEKKGISIKSDVAPLPMPVEIDPQKIEEVIDNLVSNAIKFSLPGTAITVRLAAGDEMYRIDVEDQGLGMSPEDTKRAFQRGMKLSARPTGDEPSSGLGLWIVKRLVEAHQGTVSVKSSLGIGTTFSISLPYAHNAGSSENSNEWN